MDKELLRVVIIAAGFLIVLGMLAWHFFKNKKSFQDMMFFGTQELKGKINDAIALHPENDEFDVIRKPKKSPFQRAEPSTHQDEDDLDFALAQVASNKKATTATVAEPEEVEATDLLFGDFGDELKIAELAQAPEAEPEEELELPTPPRFVAPAIIQFRVIANNSEGFNGLDLLKAFQIAQLEYGNLKIFERLDANRLVDFGVASMAGSGTFPESNMDSFFCSGLVFFMQPGVLEDPVNVFDDFLEAINIVAVELEGKLLDHEGKPLTNMTIQNIRQSL